MSRRSLEDPAQLASLLYGAGRNIRKITRVGGTSLSVTLPIEFLRKLKCLSAEA